MGRFLLRLTIGTVILGLALSQPGIETLLAAPRRPAGDESGGFCRGSEAARQGRPERLSGASVEADPAGRSPLFGRTGHEAEVFSRIGALDVGLVENVSAPVLRHTHPARSHLFSPDFRSPAPPLHLRL